MAEFQTVLGIILIVCGILVIAMAIYNLIIISKATINTSDPNATLNSTEKNAALAINVIYIVIGLVLAIYGVVLVLPEPRVAKGASAMRGSRSLSGSVLAPSGEYM